MMVRPIIISGNPMGTGMGNVITPTTKTMPPNPIKIVFFNMEIIRPTSTAFSNPVFTYDVKSSCGNVLKLSSPRQIG